MNLLWYAHRLRRMRPSEILERSRDAAIKMRWRRRQVHDRASAKLNIPSNIVLFSTPLPPVDPASISREAQDSIIRAAEELVAGRWQVFDRTRDDMASSPDWFVDPRTGHHAPSDRYAFDINHRLVDQVGTIKYVWETSRHHHLTMLAAAYFITGDDRYAELVARHLRSWWDQNPFLSGVHWTSGIELGIRLISWVWTRRLLGDWGPVRALFEENDVFIEQLFHHQAYLADLPSRGSSANNHIIAEMAGQFAACCAFPYFPETPGWREDAAARLRHELPCQTFSSGLNRELATAYHGFVLELSLAAGIEGEAAGQQLGREYWETIRRMIDALASIVDTKLQPPRQGDDDDGQGLLLDAPDFNRWASLLATGRSLFGACEWWPEAPQADLRTVLWDRLAQAPEIEARRLDKRPSLLPDAGMVILRHRLGAVDEIWCRCDHGPHGYLSIAAHAHADALSVEVRYGGVDVLSDPGTYTYQGEAEWRSYFRSTIAHNCLELDGRSQSVVGGPFMWLRGAQSTLIDVSGLETGTVAEWCASHDGYQRQRPFATHQRRVTLDREAECIVISDGLACSGQLPCRLAFHLGPTIDCRLDGARAWLSWRQGEKLCGATLLLPGELDWTATRGQSGPPMGWYSPAFGVKIPSTSLLGVGTLGAGTSLVTELRFEPVHSPKPVHTDCAQPI